MVDPFTTTVAVILTVVFWPRWMYRTFIQPKQDS